MDIIHVAAWIVAIYFGLALLKGLLGEPLYSYAIIGSISLGVIGFMALLAVAFWDSVGRFLLFMLVAAPFGIICYYIGQLPKTLYRLLRNRSTAPDSTNKLYRSQ